MALLLRLEIGAKIYPMCFDLELVQLLLREGFITRAAT